MLMSQHDVDVNTIFIDQAHFDPQYNFHNNPLEVKLSISLCLRYHILLVCSKVLFFICSNCEKLLI